MREREGETERDRDRGTERQRETERQRHTERIDKRKPSLVSSVVGSIVYEVRSAGPSSPARTADVSLSIIQSYNSRRDHSGGGLINHHPPLVVVVASKTASSSHS